MILSTARSKFRSAAALAAAVTLACTGALTASAAAPLDVSAQPVSYTPWLLQTTHDQYVFEIDQCGGLMYAVGRITAIGQGSHTYSRGYAFSFSATTGAVTSWNPQANAPIRSIAFSPDCSTAYLAGSFTSVKGVAAKGIVKVNTSNGDVISGFAHNASSEANVVEYEHGNVIVGGTFSNINGKKRTRLASLDPTTGAPTSYLTVPAVGGKVYNSQVSHSGNKMLIEGAFTSVGGATRHQIAMLDLGASSASLDNWYSNEFTDECAIKFYVRDAAWSPDDNSVYVATTGAWPANNGHSGPRRGLCDAAARFPATSATVGHNWIAYTGCDSYYAVEATNDTVYVGGHERWANNPNGCDAAGPGAVSRPGIAALNASNGLATSWNPTRALGYGADDMLLTNAGLWVASDIWKNGWAQKCGGLPKHGGICFFPN